MFNSTAACLSQNFHWFYFLSLFQEYKINFQKLSTIYVEVSSDSEKRRNNPLIELW